MEVFDPLPLVMLYWFFVYLFELQPLNQMLKLQEMKWSSQGLNQQPPNPIAQYNRIPWINHDVEWRSLNLVYSHDVLAISVQQFFVNILVTCVFKEQVSNTITAWNEAFAYAIFSDNQSKSLRNMEYIYEDPFGILPLNLNRSLFQCLSQVKHHEMQLKCFVQGGHNTLVLSLFKPNAFPLHFWLKMKYQKPTAM